jgi:hypothetical protein
VNIQRQVEVLQPWLIEGSVNVNVFTEFPDPLIHVELFTHVLPFQYQRITWAEQEAHGSGSAVPVREIHIASVSPV